MRIGFISTYRLEFLTCLFLVTITAAVYWPVHTHDFVNFDDDWYVSENPHVKKGLTIETVLWAFGVANKEGAHWHPMTWLSHLLDVELFGMRAGGHHLVSLCIHLANVVLLFMFFRWASGTVWRSALVAAFFALHPINVDSVVWVAERKNVLSSFFWFLTMLAYARYGRRPQLKNYLLVFLLFCFGIMAKQMVVTLPFVLLLMDYWPLARFDGRTTQAKVRLVLEKAPLAALSILLVFMTSLARPDIMASSESVPLLMRLQNALVSYIAYIGKLVYPVNLIVFYPFPQSIPIWQSIGALLLLSLISWLTWRFRTKGYLLVGWLWYLGTLLPVIGLLQVGLWPAMADRWAYIPFIGLFVMVVWGGEELFGARRYSKTIRLGLSLVAIAALMILTPSQVSHWQNSITLFTHVTRIAPHHVSLYNLGNALLMEGRYQEAVKVYEKVLQMEPSHARAHNNIGNALLNLGRLDEADAHLTESLRINPLDSSLITNKGLWLFVQQRYHEAASYFIKSLAMDPENFKAAYYLGLAMVQTGNIDRAIHFLRRANSIRPGDAHAMEAIADAEALKEELLRSIDAQMKTVAIEPDNPTGYYELGNLYRDAGRFEQAVSAYRTAVELSPRFANALRALGVTYAAQGKYRESIVSLKNASILIPDDPDIDYTIASVYARSGNVQESIDWLRKAIEKGFDQWETMAQDVNLADLRQNPMFQSLLKGKGVEGP